MACTTPALESAWLFRGHYTGDKIAIGTVLSARRAAGAEHVALEIRSRQETVA